MSPRAAIARVGFAAAWVCAGAISSAQPVDGDAGRGRLLYEGSTSMRASTTNGAPLPATRSACVQCHRPSGLGGFEGGSATPSITGRHLFRPLDPDTAGYFAPAAGHRVRPAYDAATLGTLLRSGVAPDGRRLRAPMPLYRIDDADVLDLTAYLRGLSVAPAPGVDATVVRIATITTPGVDAVRAQAMLTVLRGFVRDHNRQTRHEPQRRAQAQRSGEMQMNRKLRDWSLVHWALEGEPASWAAQLERHQAQAPVFGVLTGMGVDDWAPVHAFCERRQLPCILPQVERVPDFDAARAPFYSLYFHAGIDADVALAIEALQRAGVRGVEVWCDDAAVALRQRVVARLHAAGLVPLERATGTAHAVLSLLPAADHLPRWRGRRGDVSAVAWVPGAHALSAAQWHDGISGAAAAVLVSPLRPADAAEVGVRRADAWLRLKGLQALPADVAGTTLYAATVFGEAMSHLDFDFTPAYLLELLEHRLESIVPLSPYPRLAIGPGQRVASKGSFVGVAAADGRVAWEWRVHPAH